LRKLLQAKKNRQEGGFKVANIETLFRDYRALPIKFSQFSTYPAKSAHEYSKVHTRCFTRSDHKFMGKISQK
jgi:hypothetical protein